MKQLFYKIIYSGSINPFITGFIKYCLPFLPKKLKLPPSGKITFSTDKSKIVMYTNQTNYLTYCVYWDGYRNFEYTPIFEKLCQKVNCFYDIGANIGYYSLLAAGLNPEIKIKSFEPAIGPLHYLKKNVVANRFDNIKVEPIALADKNGEIDFFEVKSSKYHYIKYNLAGEGNAGSKTDPTMFVKNPVKAITPDDYLKSHSEDRIDLVKMDTEGTEHYILSKAGILLGEHKPIIICETLFDTIESELEDLLKPHGYEFYNHMGDGLKKVQTIRRTEDNGVRNCFFVHPSKKHLIEEFVL
jgi:FkbM family methyltransferase